MSMPPWGSLYRSPLDVQYLSDVIVLSEIHAAGSQQDYCKPCPMLLCADIEPTDLNQMPEEFKGCACMKAITAAEPVIGECVPS